MLLPDEVYFLKLNSFELYDKPTYLGGALLDHVCVKKVLKQFTVNLLLILTSQIMMPFNSKFQNDVYVSDCFSVNIKS